MDNPTPEQIAEIFRRLDVLAYSVKEGFVPLPSAWSRLDHKIVPCPPLCGDGSWPGVGKKRRFYMTEEEFDALTPEQLGDFKREVVRRLDVLEVYRELGFVPVPGYPPDRLGWLPGKFKDSDRCGLINIGDGPERGNYSECQSPCPLNREELH